MPSTTLAVAQIAAVRGDFAANLQRHLDVTHKAATVGTDLLIFPELSLTGYEPDLAADLAVAADGPELEPLQHAAQAGGLTVVAGCPISSPAARPWLSAVVFHPDGQITAYHKRFLHGPENDDFTPGCDPVILSVQEQHVGLAICADIHQQQHDQDLAAAGATVYAAGVAIRDSSLTRAHDGLSAMAQRHGILTMMANYSQPSGGFDIHGGTAVWSHTGARLAVATDHTDQLVIAEQSTDEQWTARTIDV